MSLVDTFRTQLVRLTMSISGWQNGPTMLAHKAEHDGVVCVEAIKGLHPHPMNELIPGCTYCSPQIASVGLTEQPAKEKQIDIRVGHFPLVGIGNSSRSRQSNWST